MGTRHKIIVNTTGRYSLWPIHRPPATGWRDTGISGSKEICIDQASRFGNGASTQQLPSGVVALRDGSQSNSSGAPSRDATARRALYRAIPDLRGDVVFAFQVDGPLDVAAFIAAVRAVSEHYVVALPSDTESGAGTPECVAFAEQSLIAASNQDLVDMINNWARTAAPGALLSTLVVRLPDEVYAIAFVADGAVFNVDSALIFSREVSEAYRAGVDARVCAPPVFLESSDASSDANRAAVQFWSNRLQDVPAALQLPTRRSIPVTRRYAYRRYDFTLSPTLVTQLLQLAERAGVSLYTVTLAALQALLYRYTGAERFIVATPSPHAAGWLPVVTALDDDMPFLELARTTQRYLHEAQAHTLLPDMIQATGLGLADGYRRLYQVVFALRDEVRDALRIPGCDVQTLIPPRVSDGIADLCLELTHAGNAIHGCLSYQPDLFDEARIAALAMHYETILAGAGNGPQEPVASLPLLSTREYWQQVTEWNRAVTVYAKQRCIHELYENQARTAARHVAVRCGTEALDYGQLNERANRLARYLRARGVSANIFVAVYLHRSIDMIVSLLAILKAGGAYIPLDPAYPRERLEYMLSDTRAPLLLTSSDMAQALPPVSADIICLDRAAQEVAAQDGENLNNVNRASDLAYVIYTSGSTGKPKGIMVPHLGVVRLVKNTNYVTIDSADVFLQFSPISFDASVLEIWGPLLNGGSLFVPPAQAIALAELAAIIRDQHITTLLLIAPLFHAMVDKHIETLANVKYLFAVGDTLSVAHVKRALSTLHRTILINGYGPSENTTFTTCHPITAADVESSTIPIGKPIANTTVYILDRALNPVPVGVIGELYTGGDGLADGYLNRPELTVQSFIANPFCEEPGSRMYKSGDLARYAADGTIEFLGRIDHQVKIRGIRIELGEVESVLASHPQLGEVVVLARDDQQGNKYLAAYAAMRAQGELTSQKVFAYLRDRLPPHLLPDAIVLLKEFRLTPNGKIDRKVLPGPREAEFVNRRFAYGVSTENTPVDRQYERGGAVVEK